MAKEQKVNAGIRIVSMLFDHIVMTFIAMFFFIPGMIAGFSTAFEISHEPSTPDLFGFNYITLIGLALYFCKDCIQGRSIAKRVLKLQVVENSSGKVASPIRCFIRNIFCIFWFIEVIVTLVNSNRRIGDLVAGTKVVPFNPEHKQPKINIMQIAFSMLLAYGIMMLMMLPLEAWKSRIKSNQVTYVASSLNEQVANETKQLFADSLGTHLTSDVRVYDQLEQDNDLKYVSVILRLNENYLENDNNYEKIKSVTVPLILAKFPEGTFVGQVQYVYQQSHSIHTRTLTLDWRKKE
ncbi:RDD family protein [Aquimarina sp. Aq78]|uniref:RDD family protein n=1 Tax=Aquimarina sp. Aq78 TaxID=1191889 RepID=UPI000D0FF379|nr:RDD family protein [Aquimarina sp. Aq78]